MLEYIKQFLAALRLINREVGPTLDTAIKTKAQIDELKKKPQK